MITVQNTTHQKLNTQLLNFVSHAIDTKGESVKSKQFLVSMQDAQLLVETAYLLVNLLQPVWFKSHAIVITSFQADDGKAIGLSFSENASGVIFEGATQDIFHAIATKGLIPLNILAAPSLDPVPHPLLRSA